jgi:hypothetical protein
MKKRLRCQASTSPSLPQIVLEPLPLRCVGAQVHLARARVGLDDEATAHRCALHNDRSVKQELAGK